MDEISLRRLIGCVQAGSPHAPDPSERLSVLNHFFGYRSVPERSPFIDPDISVRLQAARLGFRHVHLNLISVGLDQVPNADQVDSLLDGAIAFVRRVYGNVGIGIGRIERGQLLAADAQGFDQITSGEEGQELTDSFSFAGDNDGIDAFFVRSLVWEDEDVAGQSPIDGSCDNDGKGSGLIVDFSGGGSGATIGRALGHELGHYLGLSHTDVHTFLFDDPEAKSLENMMTSTGAGPLDEITDLQASIMRQHCMMRPPCR
ncbi:MAG: hypothetical protein SX243_14885 [Acidobacteriota bacterium]|nr:hypothetical protein [Acidobacteriota bacterium]